MRSVLKKVHDGLNTRTGFFILTLVLLWIKTYAVYVNKFSLGINDSMQRLLLLNSASPTGLLLLRIALYLLEVRSPIDHDDRRFDRLIMAFC